MKRIGFFIIVAESVTVSIDETIAHDFIFDKCIPFVEIVDEKVIIGASFTVEGNETPTHDFV